MKLLRLLPLTALALFAAGCAAAELEPELEPEPAGTSAEDGRNVRLFVLRVEKDKPATFTIRENVTTGFQWMAKYDAKLCKVSLGHRGSEKTQGGAPVCGAPGKAVVTVTLLADAPAELTLEYRRPWEKDTPPAEIRHYAIVPKK